MVPLDTGPGLVAFGVRRCCCWQWGAAVKWDRAPLGTGDVVGSLLVQGQKHGSSHSIRGMSSSVVPIHSPISTEESGGLTLVNESQWALRGKLNHQGQHSLQKGNLYLEEVRQGKQLIKVGLRVNVMVSDIKRNKVTSTGSVIKGMLFFFFN